MSCSYRLNLLLMALGVGFMGAGPASSQVGRVLTVCAGEQKSGWAVIDVRTDFTRCSQSVDDLWDWIDLHDTASGKTEVVCAFSPTPSDWAVTGYSTNFTRCGTNQQVNNLKTIRKM